MKIQREEAGESDPEQHGASRLERLRLHLLAAQPQLRGRGWGNLNRSSVVIDRQLGVKSEEQDQRAQHQKHSASKSLVLDEQASQVRQ